MTGGWIKLYRQSVDSGIWRLTAAGTKIALTCLLRANYKPDRFFDGTEFVEVPVGSFITSLDKLAQLSGTSKQSVRSTLKKLEYIGFATHRPTHRWSLISITKFEAYQTLDGEGNTQENTPGSTPLDPQLDLRPDLRVRPNIRNKEIKKHTRPSLSDEQRHWFEEFWRAYWRRVSRAEAEKAFARAVSSEAMFRTVMTAVEAQTPEMSNRDMRHRPHPATWLNAKRWSDEVNTVPTVNPAPLERKRPAGLTPEQLKAFADVVEGRAV